jgi:hypothetical protein
MNESFLSLPSARSLDRRRPSQHDISAPFFLLLLPSEMKQSSPAQYDIFYRHSPVFAIGKRVHVVQIKTDTATRELICQSSYQFRPPFDMGRESGQVSE